MDLTQIKNYISKSLNSGLNKEQIKNNLLSVGWKEIDIDTAFNLVIPSKQENLNPPQIQSPVTNSVGSLTANEIKPAQNTAGNQFPNNQNISTSSVNYGNSKNSNSGIMGIIRNPSKRTPVIIVGVIICLAAIGFIYSKFFVRGTGQAPTIDKKLIKADLSKYEKDTDGDGYPDYVEIAVGSDENISLYEKCYGNNPCASANLDFSQYQKDIMIILDVSGSMGLKIDSKTRMEEAKSAIIRYVNGSTDKIRFGLTIYGHKGSNSTSDKSISCASAEVIKSIGTLNKANVSSVLASITPTGWTNMGTAISEAIPAFSSSTTKNKEIVLVSDGAETCDSRPEDAARKAYQAGIKVGVIGFAVDTAASNQLKSVASAGGGSYSFANNADELYSNLEQTYENVQNWSEESKCLNRWLEDARACYGPVHTKLIDYLGNELTKLYKGEITQNEYDKLKEIYDKMLYRNTDIMKTENEKVSEKMNQNKDQVFGD